MARRIPLAARFFLTYFVITGAALSVAGLAGYLQFRAYVTEETDLRLESQARFAAEAFRPLLESRRPDLGKIAVEGDRLARDLPMRLTLVLPDGRVAADSGVGAAKVPALENHADHPEVRAALAGGKGVSQRRSISVGKDQRYVAVPVRSGERIVGVARTSVPVAYLDRRLGKIRAITWGTGVAAFLLMLAGTGILARRVTRPLTEMREAAADLASGNLGRRVRVRTGDEIEDVASALNRTASQLERTIGHLGAEKSRLATLLESLAEGVLVVGRDRAVRMMNREAGRLLGLSVPLREGETYSRAIRHPEILALIDRWREGAPLPPAEISLRLPSGERTLLMSGTTVRYPSEGETDLLLTLADVTEERRLARMKGDFVSNASHELRTPLTNIRGYVEAAQDALREGRPVDPAFLEVAHANALRMEELIGDLLDLSRSESGAAPLTIEEVSLPSFLDRVASLHREAATRDGKTLAVRGEDATFFADAGQLALAVSNLVDNAIRHGVEKGNVVLSGRVEKDAVVVLVADDGPGIPPEHIPRIFERFYRVDKGRSRERGGTGLGLSIARHIVEAHGGTIRAESRVGVGSRFTVRLPRGGGRRGGHS